MGWKNVKEHYQIGHIVQVRNGLICIGSPYVHDFITITMDGYLHKRFTGRSNLDLCRYQREIDEDRCKLCELVTTPDTFSTDIKIYTFEDGEIIEKLCKNPNWPNVTHDGELIYENTFTTDKAEAVAWAKKDLELGIKNAEDKIKEIETDLAEWKARLASRENALLRLNTEYSEELAVFGEEL